MNDELASFLETIIDYDPNASAFNRKNLILLVVEAAKNAHAPGE